MTIGELLALSGLINGITVLLLGLFVVLRNRTATNALFCAMTVAVAGWSFGYWRWLSAEDAWVALQWVRIASVAAMFIPPLYFHWISSFLGLARKERWMVRGIYGLAAAFTFTVTLPEYIASVGVQGPFAFWPVPGWLYTAYIVIVYGPLASYVAIMAAGRYREMKDRESKGQLRYIMIGTTIGFVGGATNLLMWYGIPVLPIGNFFIVLFPALLAVASLRYRLFDIKLILAELLTAMIWFIGGMEIALAATPARRVFSVELFVLMIGLGALVVRNVRKEIAQRERVERLHGQLKEAHEALEHMGRLRAEFFSFAAHQVKAPMAVIKGYASLVNGTTSNDRAIELAKKIDAAATRTLLTVNNLLDMRKIEEGKMAYVFAEADIVPPIREIVGDMAMLAREKGIELQLDMRAEHMIVGVDLQKFMQVVQNLIDNAIKYTDVGWVKVLVDSKDGNATVSVADTGRGISDEFVRHIFERFSRDPSIEKQTQGAGLGLYIAKQVVDAHGGTLHMESEGEGSGSAFTIAVPLEHRGEGGGDRGLKKRRNVV